VGGGALAGARVVTPARQGGALRAAARKAAFAWGRPRAPEAGTGAALRRGCPGRMRCCDGVIRDIASAPARNSRPAMRCL